MNKSELQQEVIRLQNKLARREEETKYISGYLESKQHDCKVFKKWAKKLRKQNLKLRAALKAIV